MNTYDDYARDDAYGEAERAIYEAGLQLARMLLVDDGPAVRADREAERVQLAWRIIAADRDPLNVTIQDAVPSFGRRPSADELRQADAQLAAFLAAWTARFGDFHPLDPVENQWLIGPYHDWCARQAVQLIGADEYIAMAMRAMQHPYRDDFLLAWRARFALPDNPKALLAVFPYFMSYDMESSRRSLGAGGPERPMLTPEQWIAMHYGPPDA